MARNAAEKTPFGIRVVTRSIQHAYSVWRMWLRILVEVHDSMLLEDVTTVIRAAKAKIPSKQQIRDIPLEIEEVTVRARSRIRHALTVRYSCNGLRRTYKWMARGRLTTDA